MRNNCKKYMSAALIGALSLSVPIMLTGCGTPSPTVVAIANVSNSPSEVNEDAEIAGIAASGNGIEITEQEVADFVKQYRMYSGNETDAKWATFLDESGKTVEDVRKEAIEKIALDKLIEKKASESGISVSDQEITGEIDTTKKELGFDGDEEGWKKLLETTKYDNETFRSDVRMNMLTDLVVGAEMKYAAPTEAQVQQFVNLTPSNYAGKKTVAIVYPSNRHSDASKAASRFSEGTDEATFREYGASETDRNSATEVVDNTWSCILQTTAAYDAAIEGLQPGEVTVFQDDNGSYKVVLCTESYIVPYSGRLSMKDMPDEIKSKATTEFAAQNRQQMEEKYKQTLLEGLSLEIADMPENLPYAVDMSLSTYGTEMTQEEEEALANNLMNDQMNQLENTATQGE